MKRAYGLSVMILLIVASGAAVLGQTAGKAGNEDVAETVSVLDHVWLDAAHNHDADTAAWLFAENFVEIHPGGILVTKQQQVDMIRNVQLGDIAIQSSDVQVRYTSPDVAVLTDTTTIRGTQGDTNYNGQYRVMRVFVKQRGRWRAAGAGIARLTAQ